MTAVPFLANRGASELRSTVLGKIKAAASAVVRPHKASLVRLTEMPLAVLGTGCVDFAAFHWHVLGWLVTGVSLWVVESLIADDDETGRM